MTHCKRQRCKRREAAGGLCKTHATEMADGLFSRHIRDWYGECVAARSTFWTGPYFACAGPLQCAHLISRSYRATRWVHDNAVSLCAGHHRWLDTHPLEKDDMRKGWLGPHRWEELRARAMTLQAPDLGAVIEELSS